MAQPPLLCQEGNCLTFIHKRRRRGGRFGPDLAKLRPVTEHKKGIYNTTKRAAYRKELRKSLTPAEAVLWKCLQRSQLLDKKFRRQFSIGRYIVDFYCPSATRYRIGWTRAFRN